MKIVCHTTLSAILTVLFIHSIFQLYESNTFMCLNHKDIASFIQANDFKIPSLHLIAH